MEPASPEASYREKPGAAEAQRGGGPRARLPPGPSQAGPLSLPCSSGGTRRVGGGGGGRQAAHQDRAALRALSRGSSWKCRCWRGLRPVVPAPCTPARPAPNSPPFWKRQKLFKDDFGRKKKKKVYTTEGTTLDKTLEELPRNSRGDNAHGYCHFSPNAQEHVTVLIVLALRDILLPWQVMLHFCQLNTAKIFAK